MSTQRRDSQQVLYPERNIIVSKMRNSNNSLMNVTGLCDTGMNDNTSKHLNLGATSLSKPDTKALQDRSLFTTNRCYNYEPVCSPLTYPALATEEQDTSLVQLNEQLETHFQSLKKEFEAKAGKIWTPLRAWTSEEWEWDDDSGAEAEGVSDSC